MALFKKKKVGPPHIKKGPITAGLWTKCDRCGEIIYKKSLQKSFKVCPKCQFHFPLTAPERVDMLVDERSFREMDNDIYPLDPLNFSGPSSYKEKLVQNQKKTGLPDAILSGKAMIEGWEVIMAVTDSHFLKGSMGSVVGEKVTRAFEAGLEEKLPVIVVSGSGGGARMYEGCLSLMQMVKTSAAVSRFSQEGLLFISVLTHPSMAGVLASFASLGDILIAEPGALIGFTGPRVIKETIRQELPPHFQQSEFLIERGLIDIIVSRNELRQTLARLLRFFLPPRISRQKKFYFA